MSGHSKWSSIKHQKGAADIRRGNLFTKLTNVITVAARKGGDPATNFELRIAIEQAKAHNMPKENIERAIKRGTGESGEAVIEEVGYEAYGPGGTAIIIEAVTDNKNRALAEIKSVLNRHGGKLAGAGAVQYLFVRQGQITAHPQDEAFDSEALELSIIDAGASDYQKAGDDYLVYTEPGEIEEVKEKLKGIGLAIKESSLTYEPKETVGLPPEESAKAVKLLEELEALGDVNNVYANMA